MGFFSRIISSSNHRSSDDSYIRLRELKQDIEELSLVVLPLCQYRPSVYNELLKTLLEWKKELTDIEDAECILDKNNGLGGFLEEDQRSAKRDTFYNNDNNALEAMLGDNKHDNNDSETNDTSSRASTAEWSGWSFSPSSPNNNNHYNDNNNNTRNPDTLLQPLPNISETPNSIEELTKDYELLLSPRLNKKVCITRMNIRKKIKSYSKELYNNMVLYKKIKKEKEIRSIQERNVEREILIYILDQTSEFQHIYNQVLVRLQSLEQTNNHSSSRRKKKRGKEKSQHDHNRWKKPPQPTSQIRWRDVQFLDEIMDTIPSDSQAHDFLLLMRESCKDEAKELTRAELKATASSTASSSEGGGGGSTTSPIDVHALLRSTDSSRRNQLQRRPSNFHLTKTLSSV